MWQHSSSCQPNYNLTENGWLNVSKSDAYTFCNQGCADHTIAVLECIFLVKQDYKFSDQRSVLELNHTITQGCINGGTFDHDIYNDSVSSTHIILWDQNKLIKFESKLTNLTYDLTGFPFHSTIPLPNGAMRASGRAGFAIIFSLVAAVLLLAYSHIWRGHALVLCLQKGVYEEEEVIMCN